MKESVWKEHIVARFIPSKLFDVNCDLYLWDDKVGICTFKGKDIDVKIYDDATMYNLYKHSLQMLWEIGLEEVFSFGPRTSMLTAVEKEFYLKNEEKVDLTDGAPTNINPTWINDYRINKTQDQFYNASTTKLMQTISRRFLTVFKAEHITLTPSATYAFLIASDVINETPGDEVILLDPGFDTMPHILRSMGCSISYALRNHDWSLSVANIKSKVTERTTSIVLCMPENPLGVVYDRTSLEGIIDFCIERGLTLITDNSFLEVSPFGRKVPLITDFPQHKKLSYLMIGDTGKILGLDGSKFGALMYSENWSEKVTHKANNYFYQLNKYDLSLLSHLVNDPRFEAYLKELNSIIARNYEYVNKTSTQLSRFSRLKQPQSVFSI